MKIKPVKGLFLALLFIGLFAYTATAEVTGTNTIFQHLVKHAYSEMNLELNFDKLFKQLKTEEEQQARLTLSPASEEAVVLHVKIKPRGVFRRFTCDIPPLRFNFSKKELEALGLEGDFDKLKLVAPCFEDPESEQQLLKEYWAYQFYNKITPASFQVHLVRITYVNTGAEKFQKEQWAFFIESKDELATRLGGKVVEQYGTTPADLEPDYYQQTMLFNYMIGNQDWDVGADRNVTMVAVEGSPSLILIPYDFDYSAFVSPTYLKGSKSIDQQNIADRVLGGQFENLEALSETAEIFLQAQGAILASFEDFAPLKQQHKHSMNKYLQDFFSLLENNKKLARHLL